jgi:hypothetical protein
MSFSAWTIEEVDSSGDFKEYNSIALDTGGKVHISYHDFTNDDLKYATNATGSWVTSTIDSSGDVGEYNSIAVDTGGKVHISYYDWTNGDLKYAKNVSGSWFTYTIESLGYVGRFTSIAVDTGGKVHISYRDDNYGYLKYVTNATGSWVTSTIDSSGDFGWASSIALDTGGKVHISYYDYGGMDLKYATNATGSWVTSTIDSSGDVGEYNSIAVDTGGKVHISYDYYGMDLKYATNATGSWVTSTIDSSGIVGEYNSIAVDTGGKVHISYLDHSGRLKYATNATGSWVTSTIDNSGYLGWASSIAVDTGGKVHISYYDYGGMDLKYTTNAIQPPTGLSLTQIAGGFRISWDNVSEVTSYQIYWGNDSSVSETNKAGIIYEDASPSDHTGLVNGWTYYYRIRACNSSGCSPLSSIVSDTYQAQGFASVSQGVTVSPGTVFLGQNFTVGFTLKEVNGAPIMFEQIAVAILRSDDSLLFDLATYSDITIPANGTWSQSPTGQIYTSNPPGTYKAMIRGKVAGGNWFNFSQTGSGVNPRIFTAMAPPQYYTLNVTIDPGSGGSVSGVGISCPNNCTEQYLENTQVILTANANSGYSFESWTGCNYINSDQCTVIMNSVKSLTAKFNSPPEVISVEANPTHSSNSLSVEFTCNALDPDGDTLLYFWDFDNDGNIDIFYPDLKKVNHTYPSPNTYNALCRVNDSKNNPSITAVSIQVKVPEDLDEDGLPDAWEKNGFDLDGDGSPDELRVPGSAEKAEIGIKDIFVWVDHMYREGYSGPFQLWHLDTINTEPSKNVIEAIKRSFADRGIILHVDYGDEKHRVQYAKEIDDAEVKSGLQKYKNRNFPERLRHVYRYALFIDAFKSAKGGFSTFPRPIPEDVKYEHQAIAVATRGDLDDDITLRANFMHELGHSLGLCHGGPCYTEEMKVRVDDVDDYGLTPVPQYGLRRKPNYLSVMNDLYGKGLSRHIPFRPDQEGILDYSFAHFDYLDETGLIEDKGVKLEDGTGLLFNPRDEGAINDYNVFYYCGNVLRKARVGQPIDWNCKNGFENIVNSEINKTFKRTRLETDTDWDKLVYTGTGACWKIGKELSQTMKECPDESIISLNSAYLLLGKMSLSNSELPLSRHFGPFMFKLVTFKKGAFSIIGEPGKHVVFGAYLMNTGTEADTYIIKSETADGWPIVLQSQTVSLEFGHRKVLQVIVQVPESATVGTEEQIRLYVASQGNEILEEGQIFYIKVSENLPIDSDGDNLPDEQELRFVLDPNNPDTDGDGIFDGIELIDLDFPEDLDHDGLIDAKDPHNLSLVDSDGDGISDIREIAFGLNPDNQDTDNDGIGDSLEVGTPRDDDLPIDYDGDGVIDALEPGDSAFDGPDPDGDGIGNNFDNCDLIANTDQLDSDFDSFGNVCDNCPYVFNGDQLDTDGDGIGDACESSSVLTLVLPNGGDVLPSGGTYGICWKAPLNAVKFDLRYSINNGTSWNLIKTVTGLNCTHWEIPVATVNKKKCRVKVIGYDSNGVKIGEDVSDKPFTIEVVRVTSPNGGETLKTGSTWTIRWVSHETIRPVAKTVLKYTTDGTAWKTIKTLTGNPGIYSWTVPPVSSTRCKVKVILKDANGVNVGSDVSDKVFTIQP